MTQVRSGLLSRVDWPNTVIMLVTVGAALGGVWRTLDVQVSANAQQIAITEEKFRAHECTASEISNDIKAIRADLAEVQRMLAQVQTELRLLREQWRAARSASAE